MQGGVLTPLKFSVQIDTLGKEMLSSTESAKALYKYKDCVIIPPLSFSPNSVKVNAYVQSKVETKKLELSDTKCVKMHLGNNKSACPKLKIHSNEMKSSDREKYLGNGITSNARMDDNIQMRHDKGIGIANQILSILTEVSFVSTTLR